MPIFYCTANGAGPLAHDGWSARISEVGQSRADAERIVCPSHVVRNGNGPRTQHIAPRDVAALIDSGALVLNLTDDPDEHGGRLACVRVSEQDGSETLLCPECDAPVRMVESAPAWEPPANLVVPEPPAPRIVYQHIGNGPLSTTPQTIATPAPDWQFLGNLPASAARVAGVLDTSGLVGGLLGAITVTGGRVGLRLTERDLTTGSERVLILSSQPPGTRALEIRTAPPAPGPCLYVLEGQVVDEGATATLSAALVSLYAVASE